MIRFLHTGDWQLGMTCHIFQPVRKNAGQSCGHSRAPPSADR